MPFTQKLHLPSLAKTLLPSALFGNVREKSVRLHHGQRTQRHLYVGVTSNLIKRVWQHKREKKGFTGRYKVFDLVYFEQYLSMEAAIVREKQIKKWKRHWKMRLIEQMNPDWDDLWTDILR